MIDTYFQDRLTNQLALFGSTNWEISHLAKQLDIDFNVPRCAILLEEKQGTDSTYSFAEALQLIMSSHPEYSGEIFGSISNEHFLIFKSTAPDTVSCSGGDDVRSFIDAVRELCSRSFGISFTAYAGSVYTNLAWMHASFDETQFLSTSPLIQRDEDLISIDDHIGEYLVNILGEEHLDIFLGEYKDALGGKESSSGQSKTLDCIMALIANSYNTSRAAAASGLHRNTILQRMAQLEERTELDPVHVSSDRAALHTFAVLKNKPNIWNASINIRPGNIIHLGFDHFADVLEEKSEGMFKLNVNVVSDSGDYRTLFDAVRNNEIECAAVNSSILGSIFSGWPDIFEIPFLFRSEEEAQYLMNHSIRNGLRSALDNSGAMVMTLWSMGWREFSSPSPILVPGDLDGKKIRALFSSGYARDFFESVGAELFYFHYSDVARAISAGVIDAQENPYSNILDMEFYKHHSYVTDLKAFYDANAFLCSEQAWNNLAAELKEVFWSALEESSAWLAKTAGKINREALKKLADAGMTVIRPDEEEAALWREALADAGTFTSHPDLYNSVLRERRVYRDSK